MVLPWRNMHQRPKTTVHKIYFASFQIVRVRESSLRGCDVQVLDISSDCTRLHSRHWVDCQENGPGGRSKPELAHLSLQKEELRLMSQTCFDTLLSWLEIGVTGIAGQKAHLSQSYNFARTEMRKKCAGSPLQAGSFCGCAPSEPRDKV